jgi:hypothetical protein
MTRRLFMGIDPGMKGSVSVIDERGDPKLIFELEGMNCSMIWTVFGSVYNLWQGYKSLTSIMEKVGGYNPGSKGNIGSRMFTFGANYGRLQMALKAKGISWKEVTPRVWQKEFEVVEKSGPKLKRELKEIAQGLFSQTKVTLNIADSLLISEYCRRKNVTS